MITELEKDLAASEAMIMMFNTRSRKAVKEGKNILFVDENIFPQTYDVIITRSKPLDIEVVKGKYDDFEMTDKVFGAILQYPAANGEIRDYEGFTKKAHENEVVVTAVADILALTVLKSPGEWDADIVVGSTQRFGVPMGYGGPHAAYLATKEAYKRQMPGRIIGISVDRHGNPALRMALQTREQHIKRERATSNICTAQALLATMAGMYAVYHGPEGLKEIAYHTHSAAGSLATQIRKLGYTQNTKNFFDTIEFTVSAEQGKKIKELAEEACYNFHFVNETTIRLSTDETTSKCSINRITEIFAKANSKENTKLESIEEKVYFNSQFERTSEFLKEAVFHKYHSETEMMRYIKKLERRDISLTHSMIPLGSCTMKLNSAIEMIPESWAEFGNIHPFVPLNQVEGYHEMITELEKDLAAITGFTAVSLQPNSGAAGEYTGLLVINKYHENRNEGHRNICLIPSSAHGTNPASAAMAGQKVVVVKCDEKGNIDIDDLRAKSEEHKDNLNSFMVTYPSTHGVFEDRIKEMMDIIHDNGGLVYMDGANMNAQVGLTNPGIIGADVCHLNLHKTFAIPHGGGGPGIGPIGVNDKLKPFLPTHPVVKTGGENPIKAVAAAPWGSAGVLQITYAYIKLMGLEGLKKATIMSIVNANYLASGLKKHYDILYTGATGRVAHEMILDCRSFKATYGADSSNLAKRLMDYGFHAPTMSFPVHETLMVEPTESESLQELDRFIDTMISIKNELEDLKAGKYPADNNPLVMAPHTMGEVTADNWDHPYSRQIAAYPLEWIMPNKFWPAVATVDNGYGDRNLVCSCAPIEAYQ